MSVNKLNVWRTLGDGSRLCVGTLAQNRQGIFFQYQAEYLAHGQALSPFKLKFDGTLQKAERTPHQGLFGVFADALPDGWGLLLMDRVFRRAGVLPSQITPLDRLAFIGQRGMGALSYEPVSDLQPADESARLSVAELGLQAQALFEGQTNEVLAALTQAGSSGGARPKAQLYLHADQPDVCSTVYQAGSRAYLVKFTSPQFNLGHEEGLCEAAYLSMAKQAGIVVPDWQLLDAPATSGAKKWLALARFDTTENNGRLHLHSACGLLDADFRSPSLDYADLIKASSLLCRSPAAGQAQFRRAVFNLFALNQDDHSKNSAFLQDDNGNWQLSPFYDATFSPSPYGEHSTAFAGFGKQPPLNAMQKLASLANFANWHEAQHLIAEVIEAIQAFSHFATQLGVSEATIQQIRQQLAQVYQDNKVLLKS